MTAARMRALGERAAAACENATTPGCKCRCGGRLHGAGRAKLTGGGAAGDVSIWDLPAEDPHHPKNRPTRDEQLDLFGRKAPKAVR